MKTLFKVLLYLSGLLMIYGIVAAVLGINLIIHSSKYAEAAIFGGVGLAIAIVRYELLLGKLNNDNAELIKYAEEIQNGFKRLQSDVDGDQKRIEGIMPNIKNLETSTSELRLNVESLQTKDKELESGVQTLQTKTASLTSGFETLQTRVTTLEVNIEGLQTKTVGLSGNIDKLHQDFGGLHKSFGGLHEEVGTLHGDLSAVHGDFESVHKDLGGLHREIGEIRSME